MDRNNISLRILSGLVLIAAIAGIAYVAFQAGVAQGSPIAIEAPSGETAPLPYPYYGWGGPFHRPFGFGIGCFGALFLVLLFFLAMKAVRILFWGPRWGWAHHGRHGPWGWHRSGGVPPMFDEWHRRAHGESEEEKE